MKELDRIFAEHEAGIYTELETYVRIARITTKENIDQIIRELPAQYTGAFAQWIAAYPYKHEVKVVIGEPLESLTDELLAYYKQHYQASQCDPDESPQ